MNKKQFTVLLLLLFIQFSLSELALAETIYFETNFESGSVPINTPSPIWSISSSFTKVFGPGNNFELSAASSHSGTYSLRFDYEGRNGFCNVCGFKPTQHKQGLNSASYFVSNSGENLSRDPFFAAPGRVIFNSTNGFSKWEITSIKNHSSTNDRLSLERIGNSISGHKAEFNGGDTVYIARQCGVDGYIGKDIDRRSDCDLVITYFDNVSGSQFPGQSIFRRMYIKADITSPAQYQKLRYWSPEGDAHIILMGATETGKTTIFPKIEGLRHYGGQNIYRPGTFMTDGISFERDIWYYVEEEFKAQSAPNKADGIYRLWFAKSGEETSTPLLEVQNLMLPVVKKTSLWGNIQHWNDVHGSWYLDDIKISDTRIGPTDATGHNVSPPKPPRYPRTQ